MTKNDTLSKFLRDKRKKLKKTGVEISQMIGIPNATYSSWEIKGKLPRDEERLEKLATVLETTRDELLEKAGVSTADQQNIIPMLRAIVECNCPTMFLDDIEFLLDVQAGLDQPMNSSLIQELMKHRVAQTNGQQTPENQE